MIATRPLFTALPLPRGIDAEGLTDGYLIALEGLPLDALKSVVVKLIRGVMPDQPKFCPRPPELAQMVRNEARRVREADEPKYIPPPKRETPEPTAEAKERVGKLIDQFRQKTAAVRSAERKAPGPMPLDGEQTDYWNKIMAIPDNEEITAEQQAFRRGIASRIDGGAA